MTGTTLDTYEYIPRSVLECAAMQLKVRAPMLATLRALSRRVMTRHRLRNWACRYLRISRMTVADEETLFSALIAEMSVAVDRAQLESNHFFGVRCGTVAGEQRSRSPSALSA
jgi:hypothetical protein